MVGSTGRLLQLGVYLVDFVQRVQIQRLLVLMVVVEVALMQLVWVQVLGWGMVVVMVMVMVNGWVRLEWWGCGWMSGREFV